MIRTICTAAAAMALLTGAAQAQTTAEPQSATPPADASQASAQTSQSAAPAPQAQSGGVLVTSTVDASGTTIRTFTNGPVPDTAENRKLFPPLSETGRNTKPRGQ